MQTLHNDKTFQPVGHSTEDMVLIRKFLLHYAEKSIEHTKDRFNTIKNGDGRIRTSNPNDVATRVESQSTNLAICRELSKNIQKALETISLIDDGWEGSCTICDQEFVPLKRIEVSFGTTCVGCQEKKEKAESVKNSRR